MAINIRNNKDLRGKIFKVSYLRMGTTYNEMVMFLSPNSNVSLKCQIMGSGRIIYLWDDNFDNEYIIKKYPEYLI